MPFAQMSPMFRRPRSAATALVLAMVTLSPWTTAGAQTQRDPAPAGPVRAGAGGQSGGQSGGLSGGLYQCVGPNGGTIFRSTPREGCVVLASPDPTPDPQRWLPVMGGNGVMSYLDQRSIRRYGAQLGVIVMRNLPAGGIRTASGEPIASSLKRMVLDCTTSMYAVVEQTLFPRRYARGEPLYTMRPPRSAPQPAAAGTLAREVLNRLCH